MADIISGSPRFNGNNKYTKNKNIIVLPGGETPDTGDYDGAIVNHKIKKHRRNLIIALVVMCVVILICIFIARRIYDGITYSSYSISNSINRDDTSAAQYIDYENGYIRYSNDGIAYYTNKGKSIWNQTYTMQKPQIKMCGDCVAVGDVNGSKIYIFNTEGQIGSVDTSLSITQIEVAKQGVVAAVLEDNEANYINLYNIDGSKIYTVKTTITGDGYPLDISISEDGTKLIASFLYVSGEEMKTNVVFYNFSEVGQNVSERVVGGFNNYDSTIVGDVQFMNATTAIAVGEDIMSIYKIKEYPSLSKEITFDSEIQRVFFGDEYIGIVFDNSQSGDIYRLVVYSLSGSKVCETTFNTKYDEIRFDGNSIIMCNSSTLTLMNLKGKILADINSELPIDTIVPMGSRGKYILINSKYIQNIRLK